MWLATKFGFYSIVHKSNGHFHVRGRVRKDLENLIALVGLETELHEWPLADYRYRVIVTRAQFTRIMAALALDLDYPNFKSQIAATPDQRGKLSAFHEIWEILSRLQES